MRRIVLLAAVLVLAPAGAALADSFDSVFKDYTADGRINPCKHSAAELQRARANIPPDIQQYAPDFPEALDAAIEARARGQCAPKKPAPAAPAAAPTPAVTPPPSSGGGGGGPSAPAPAATTAAPPAPVATAAPAGAPTDQAIARAASASGDHGDGAAPAPLVGLGVLAVLAALSALGYALVRWRAWEPGWALRARHSLGEAGWRISATWAEFADWVRLGQR